MAKHAAVNTLKQCLWPFQWSVPALDNISVSALLMVTVWFWRSLLYSFPSLPSSIHTIGVLFEYFWMWIHVGRNFIMSSKSFSLNISDVQSLTFGKRSKTHRHSEQMFICFFPQCLLKKVDLYIFWFGLLINLQGRKWQMFWHLIVGRNATGHSSFWM